MFNGVYKNKRILITGHTGFKGSYLALWLKKLGADLVGISLPIEDELSHWKLINLDMESHYFDIKNLSKLRSTIEKIKPDIIFHLAAQALVINSYHNPIKTWTSNLVGTVNILESSRKIDNLEALVCITTDKCYQNINKLEGYEEKDAMGGYDPYSASKAACEIAIASYRNSFFNNSRPLVASARSGNVIGGGDWSDNRLIPDLMRAIVSGSSLEIRSPKATRPWHHVLETTAGYLRLGQCLLEGNETCASAYNFGPSKENNCSVETLLTKTKDVWNKVSWQIDSKNWPYEASELYLNSQKANNELNWSEVWDLNTSIFYTIEWYRAWYEENIIISNNHLDLYFQKLKEQKFTWMN